MDRNGLTGRVGEISLGEETKPVFTQSFELHLLPEGAEASRPLWVIHVSCSALGLRA